MADSLAADTAVLGSEEVAGHRSRAPTSSGHGAAAIQRVRELIGIMNGTSGLTQLEDPRGVLMSVANTYATDTRVRREARALASEGYDVEVLCWDRQGRRPSKERIDGCQVRNIRLGKTTVLVSSKLYYLIAAVLFQAVTLLWAIRRIRHTKALVLHAHDFNTLIGCAAARLLLRERARLIYDCHELTPGAYEEWYGPVVSGVVGRFELAALRWIDAIIAANEAIFRHLTRYNRIRGVVLYTCPAIGEIPEIEPLDAKVKLGLGGLFVVLFSGRARREYDLDMLLNAARGLKRDNLLDIKFVFTGPPETASTLRSRAINEGLQTLFDFRGWVPDEELLVYYKASELCFAVTRDLGMNTRNLTPIKLFESMACGVPVVVRDGTLAADIVRRWSCGLVTDRTSDGFLAELISLKEQVGRFSGLAASGRNAFHQAYNWDLMQARLFGLYTEVLSTRPDKTA